MSRGTYLRRLGAGCLMAIALLVSPLLAEKLKIAVGQRGNWDSSVSDLGVRAGIFAKHGLELDIVYTQGGGETQQVVISGSADIGANPGTLGVLNAYARGAPLRVIGGQTTGAADFWYVRADSRMHSLGDATPSNTIAYSANGSSTHSIVLALIKEFGLKARPVATGNPQATFTQVMSGQIDIGWSSPPFALDAIDANRIRVIARARDTHLVQGATIRVIVTTEEMLLLRLETLRKFMRAYRETIDWMYEGDVALKHYAEFARTTVPLARRIRAEFFPKAMLDPGRVSGLDKLMAEAVAFKTMAQPLTDAEFRTLVQIID
jgi:NitT/TauT family transport system substrate-binding protein